MTILLFSLAFQSLFLGILGEYVARVYKSSMDEPLTIIESEIQLIPADTHHKYGALDEKP